MHTFNREIVNVARVNQSTKCDCTDVIWLGPRGTCVRCHAQMYRTGFEREKAKKLGPRKVKRKRGFIK